MKVADFMQTNVITIRPEAQIREIAKILCENGISGAPVVDSSGKIVGMVSEGDLLYKEAYPRTPDSIGILGAIFYSREGVRQYEDDFKKLMALKASEIMTPNAITIDKEAEIEEAATVMRNNRIKRLPVVENGKLIGIITRRDIIKSLIEE